MLCGYDCIWVPTTDDRIPVGAFPGGYAENNHETLYIGRVEHNGHMIPGKVQPSHKVCYFSFEGRELAKGKFDILVDPNISMKSASKNYVSVIDVDSASDSDHDDDDNDYNWSPSDQYEDDEDHAFIF